MMLMRHVEMMKKIWKKLNLGGLVEPATAGIHFGYDQNNVRELLALWTIWSQLV